MKIAYGVKAHSGWAAVVALASDSGSPLIVERCRLELVEPGDADWAKQPYHAAERSGHGSALDVVARGIQSARRIAVREVRAATLRAQSTGHDVVAWAVLMGEPMPEWTVDETLAVHFRMHKAEGVLFKDALARAVDASGIRRVAISEKRLDEHAARALSRSASRLRVKIAALGKSIGPPWGQDQKDAALAALIALEGRA